MRPVTVRRIYLLQFLTNRISGEHFLNLRFSV